MIDFSSPVYEPSDIENIVNEGYCLKCPEGDSQFYIGNYEDGVVHVFFFECLDDAYDKAFEVSKQMGSQILVSKTNRLDIKINGFQTEIIVYKGFNTNEINLHNV